LFVENMGMVRRVVTTIAGPRSYDPVSARIGKMTLTAWSGSMFRVTTEVERGVARVKLELSLTGGAAPIRLKYPSSQQFDMEVRNEAGEVVYRWSSDKLFLPFVQERTVSMLQYEVEVPIEDLRSGLYKVTGWLTAGESRREFSGSTEFHIEAPPAVQ